MPSVCQVLSPSRGAPAPLERQAEARILWSEKALHLRFICHQGEPLVVSDKPQTEKKTMGLWNRDVCEEEDVIYADNWRALAARLDPLLRRARV